MGKLFARVAPHRALPRARTPPERARSARSAKHDERCRKNSSDGTTCSLLYVAVVVFHGCARTPLQGGDPQQADVPSQPSHAGAHGESLHDGCGVFRPSTRGAPLFGWTKIECHGVLPNLRKAAQMGAGERRNFSDVRFPDDFPRLCAKSDKSMLRGGSERTLGGARISRCAVKSPPPSRRTLRFYNRGRHWWRAVGNTPLAREYCRRDDRRNHRRGVRAWELGRPYLTWWKATVPPDTILTCYRL